LVWVQFQRLDIITRFVKKFETTQLDPYLFFYGFCKFADLGKRVKDLVKKKRRGPDQNRPGPVRRVPAQFASSTREGAVKPTCQAGPGRQPQGSLKRYGATRAVRSSRDRRPSVIFNL
jgi:hypothetical protein